MQKEPAIADTTTTATAPENTDFGAYLKAARMALGLSGNAVAARAGISGPLYYMLERGRRPAPKPHKLKPLAEALKVPFSDLCAAANLAFLFAGESEEEKATRHIDRAFEYVRLDPMYRYGYGCNPDEVPLEAKKWCLEIHYDITGVDLLAPLRPARPRRAPKGSANKPNGVHGISTVDKVRKYERSETGLGAVAYNARKPRQGNKQWDTSRSI